MNTITLTEIENVEAKRNIENGSSNVVVGNGSCRIENKSGELIAYYLRGWYDDMDVVSEVSWLADYDLRNGEHIEDEWLSVDRDLENFADETCAKLVSSKTVNSGIAESIPNILSGGVEAYQKFAPNHWKYKTKHFQQDSVESIYEDEPITIVTINKNVDTKLHRDNMTEIRNVAAMAHFKVGDFEGGHLVFPEYSVELRLQHNDMVLMDGEHLHGRTNILGASEGDYRISVPMGYWSSTDFEECL